MQIYKEYYDSYDFIDFRNRRSNAKFSKFSYNLTEKRRIYYNKEKRDMQREETKVEDRQIVDLATLEMRIRDKLFGQKNSRKILRKKLNEVKRPYE